MKNIFINLIESTQLKNNLPYFKVGYFVEVDVWVNEVKKRRIQTFKGLVIAKKNNGINSAFTVRKISHGEGVEKVFQTHSPVINNIRIISKYCTNKSKLYHFRRFSKKNINKVKLLSNINYNIT